MTILKSPRLELCPLTQKHFEEFCLMDMDAEVMKYYTSRPHGSREDARKSFDRYMDYMAKFPHLGGFAAFSRGNGEFVGLGVLIHLELNPSNSSFEVGYRLPVHQWGKGYATEIARVLLGYGFDSLNLREIFGTTNPENLVSEKVLTKIGFDRIGTTPHYGVSNLFKITKEKFKALV